MDLIVAPLALLFHFSAPRTHNAAPAKSVTLVFAWLERTKGDMLVSTTQIVPTTKSAKTQFVSPVDTPLGYPTTERVEEILLSLFSSPSKLAWWFVTFRFYVFPTHA